MLDKHQCSAVLKKRSTKAKKVFDKMISQKDVL